MSGEGDYDNNLRRQSHLYSAIADERPGRQPSRRSGEFLEGFTPLFFFPIAIDTFCWYQSSFSTFFFSQIPHLVVSQKVQTPKWHFHHRLHRGCPLSTILLLPPLLRVLRPPLQGKSEARRRDILHSARIRIFCPHFHFVLPSCLFPTGGEWVSDLFRGLDRWRD